MCNKTLQLSSSPHHVASYMCAFPFVICDILSNVILKWIENVRLYLLNASNEWSTLFQIVWQILDIVCTAQIQTVWQWQMPESIRRHCHNFRMLIHLNDKNSKLISWFNVCACVFGVEIEFNNVCQLQSVHTMSFRQSHSKRFDKISLKYLICGNVIGIYFQ